MSLILYAISLIRTSASCVSLDPKYSIVEDRTWRQKMQMRGSSFVDVVVLDAVEGVVSDVPLNLVLTVEDGSPDVVLPLGIAVKFL